MATELLFLDTSYIVRLYLEDEGCTKVRHLVESRSTIATAWHARAEIVAALHRACREKRIGKREMEGFYQQFDLDCHAGLFVWQYLTESVMQRLETVFRSAPSTSFLRAADALHLACAAEYGFEKVYSNDRHLLAAAPLFGVQGIDVISS